MKRFALFAAVLSLAALSRADQFTYDFSGTAGGGPDGIFNNQIFTGKMTINTSGTQISFVDLFTVATSGHTYTTGFPSEEVVNPPNYGISDINGFSFIGNDPTLGGQYLSGFWALEDERVDLIHGTGLDLSTYTISFDFGGSLYDATTGNPTPVDLFGTVTSIQLEGNKVPESLNTIGALALGLGLLAVLRMSLGRTNASRT